MNNRYTEYITKRVVFYFAVTAVFMAIFQPSASAQNLNFTFDFNAPMAVDRNGKDGIKSQGLFNTMIPGKPELPFKPIRILLPFGYDMDTFEISSSKGRTIQERYEPALTPLVVPYSFGPIIKRRNQVRKLLGHTPKVNLYDSFPGKAYDNFSIQNLDGYRVLFLNLYPFDYDPSTKSITIFDSMNLSVNLKKQDTKLNSKSSFNSEAKERINKMVQNPKVLGTYPVQAKNSSNGYLIISSKELLDYRGENSFYTLSNRLNKAGYTVSMAAVEDIIDNENGKDSAAKVRNYIKRVHENKNIKMVLLGGDGDSGNPIIPVRCLNATFEWEGRVFSENLPADVYYSCLDGTFDDNENGVYGEYDDGINNGDIDMLAEVSVGRATVDSIKELINFVRKSIQAHDMAEKGKRGTVLFAGESLFPGIYGKFYMAEIQYGAQAHDFKTKGLPPDYPFDHLFDRDKRWGSRQITEKLNTNIYWINHVGHSSPSSSMRLYSSSPDRLTNSNPYMLYTQGCQCGRFIVDDCIMERHITAEHGAFAVFSNSHYGLGPEDPDPDESVNCRGASQYFHRQFMDALFNEGITHIGDANQDSKEDNIPFMNHGTTRWVFFEMNLFGDPSINVVK